MTDFRDLVNLASERLGAAAIAANDDFFAPKENLVKDSAAVFREGEYTDRGKWMDGWETRRRRTPGFDWCIVRLALPGIIRGVVADTSFFKGNYPEACSIEAMDGNPELGGEWIEILPRSTLHGDSENPFAIDCSRRFTHVRLNIYPDGGVARLRVYGEVLPDWAGEDKSAYMDLAAIGNGAAVVAASDMFFGSRHNLILPGPSRNMGDGWETRRRRGPGYDWVVIKLAGAGEIEQVEVDTSFYKGNYPESCSLEAAAMLDWRELLPRTELEADSRKLFHTELVRGGEVTHVRLNIFPDGGVARLRVNGRLSRDGRMEHGLRRLNAQSPAAAEAALLRCCGSRRWAELMAKQRPFGSSQQILTTAGDLCKQLTPSDWLEAFAQHPRIGERADSRWSQQEQSAAQGAEPQVLAELARLNQEYGSKFGYIYIVCATGKTAGEMLDLLRRRLGHDPQDELRIAAGEQERIAHLRLEKLLES